MTTVSLIEQTECQPITPKSSTCVPICMYRQKVTKGFHLVGSGSVNSGISPLKGVSLQSRENSQICAKYNKIASAPSRWEARILQGDVKHKTGCEIKEDHEELRGKEHKQEDEVRESSLSVVGERLHSLSNLSCVLGTTPLIRTRRHTPECERQIHLSLTPETTSGSTSCESTGPIATPDVPPCSPAPCPSSPVKKFALDGIKICGLAVSRSASQPRDFVSGHVRKITYCCDKCELRMLEHEAMLLERSNSCLAYRRYSPQSCSPQNRPPEFRNGTPVASDDYNGLKGLSQLLWNSRGQIEHQRSPQMASYTKDKRESEEIQHSSRNEEQVINTTYSKSVHSELEKEESQRESDHESRKVRTERDSNKKVEMIENEENNEKQRDSEKEKNKTNRTEEINTEKEKVNKEIRFETDSDSNSVSSESVNKLKSGKTKEITEGQGSIIKEKSKQEKQTLDETDAFGEVKEQKEDSKNDTESTYRELKRKDNLTFASDTSLQDMFATFKEKLFKLPKILNELKISNDALPLLSSTSNTEETVSTEADEEHFYGSSRRQSSRDCSSRLMDITSREKLQQILRDCEDVIDDVPNSFLPDISMPSRDICYTAMIDKRYNRWKSRRRRKTKKSRDPSTAPSPTDSSSEENKLGYDRTTPEGMESEQRNQLKFRRRRRISDDYNYMEEEPFYCYYDASSEMTSSSDKDGRYFQDKKSIAQENYHGYLDSISGQEKRILSAILNGKDQWKERKEKDVITDSTHEDVHVPQYHTPVAPPLVSQDIEGPYLHSKESKNQQQHPENRYLNWLRNGKQFASSGNITNGKIIFSTKSDNAPAKVSGQPLTRKDITRKDINTAGFMGNKKQLELFTKKYQQTVANEAGRTSLGKIGSNSSPLKLNCLPKTNLGSYRAERKSQPTEKESQDKNSAIEQISQGIKVTKVEVSNKTEKLKPQKSGLDRRKCINAKKGSTKQWKPPKVPQMRSQSHQTVRKEMPRTISSLSFSPAFTFSFFELPDVYQSKNEGIARRASTAFSKTNLYLKNNR